MPEELITANEYQDLLEACKRYCEKYQLKYTTNGVTQLPTPKNVKDHPARKRFSKGLSPKSGWQTIKVEFPAGHTVRHLTIRNGSQAEAFLKSNAHEIVFLEHYQGFCRPCRRVIVALVEVIGGQTMEEMVDIPPPTPRFMVSPNSDFTSWYEPAGAAEPEAEDYRLNLEKKINGKTVSIVVEDLNDDNKFLLGPSMFASPAAGITISEFEYKNQSDAESRLVDVANSLFLDVANSLGCPIGLRKYHPLSLRSTTLKTDWRKEGLPFPIRKYHKEPMALFWYGVSARLAPLLQFLAFYQVLEFYFPKYSLLYAIRKARDVLTSPGFNPADEKEMIRLLTTIKPSSPKQGFGNDKEHLKSTLKVCVDEADLRQFLQQEPRAKFLSKDKKLSRFRLTHKADVSELITDISNRVYEIRCRIVHVKQAENGGDTKPIFPYSDDEALLTHDIELMQFLANTVMHASSGTLVF